MQEESVGNRCESSCISFYHNRKPESRLVWSDVGEFKKGKLAGLYPAVPILPSASSHSAVIDFFAPRRRDASSLLSQPAVRAPVRARIASARQRLCGCFRTAVFSFEWDQPLSRPPATQDIQQVRE